MCENKGAPTFSSPSLRILLPSGKRGMANLTPMAELQLQLRMYEHYSFISARSKCFKKRIEVCSDELECVILGAESKHNANSIARRLY